MEYLLPIGTVVQLKGGEKRLMVFGIRQTDSEGDDTEYDYVAVPYPEGNMGIDLHFLFNHEEIDTVFFRGFEDIERQSFIQALTRAYEEKEETDRQA